MKQSKTKWSEILEIFLNEKMKNKVIANQYGFVILIALTVLNTKVMVIEMIHYQLHNILIKIDQIWKTS